MNPLLALIALAAPFVVFVTLMLLVGFWMFSSDREWGPQHTWVSRNVPAPRPVTVTARVRRIALLRASFAIARPVALFAASVIATVYLAAHGMAEPWAYIGWVLAVFFLGYAVMETRTLVRLRAKLTVGLHVFSLSDDGVQFGDVSIPWGSVREVGIVRGRWFLIQCDQLPDADANGGVIFNRKHKDDQLPLYVSGAELRCALGRSASRAAATSIADEALRRGVPVRKLGRLRDMVMFFAKSSPSTRQLIRK